MTKLKTFQIYDTNLNNMNSLKNKPINQWTDEEVLNEVHRIAYLSKLKSVMRYQLLRNEEHNTESVAEHTFAMFNLARYFLPLEDPERTMNWEKVMTIIIWHDLGEIEMDRDILGLDKTDADRKQAREGLHDIYKNTPELLRVEIETHVEEYETRVSLEAKFVNALDKIEPAFELFRPGGAERVINGMKLSKEKAEGYYEIKFRATKDFPYLSKFTYVMLDEFMRNYYG